jgi:hypothetical protein
MRTVSHLSGQDSLKRRIHYVAQDLFIRPSKSGGTVLLIDDIYNTGASARVYAHALKEHAGVDAVHVVNLAATRFHKGRDGHGRLNLDLAGLNDHPDLSCVWLDSNSVYHRSAECANLQASACCEMLFLAQQKGGACPACSQAEHPVRKWWQFWN